MAKAKDIKAELSKIVGNTESVEKLETLFNESVEEKAVLISEKRIADATTQIKHKYDLISEEFIKSQVAKQLNEEKEKLVKVYDEKLVLVENKINKQLDKFIDQEILPQVSADQLTKIAINESLLPIVTGVKKVLEENGIVINNEAKSLLVEARDEIVRITNDNNDLIKKNMVLNEKLESVAKHLLIQEKTEGMTASARKQITALFEGRDFEETEGKISAAIELLTESTEVKEPEPVPAGKADLIENLETEIKEEKEVINEEKSITPESLLDVAAEYAAD